MIHPSAIIDTKAELDTGVSIGPYCVIGADVKIARDSRIESHVVINGPTSIGSDNHIYSFAAIGGDPQDKKYRGEDAYLKIGNKNTIRENCTISRGTADGAGCTRIGDDNWIMAYVHIAHDCKLGSHTILANAASLAGHVEIADHAILGGFSLIHQFCRVGAYAFTSMSSVINRDVPPFFTVAGHMAKPRGVNSEGLKRHGFDKERRSAIKKAYRLLYKSGLSLAAAQEHLQELAKTAPDIQLLTDFLRDTQRSITR